jgi:membrane-associated phospholipid phosphatase
MNIFEKIDTSISESLTNSKLKNSIIISLLSYIGSVFSILVFLTILFACFDKKMILAESICSLIYATGIVFILKFTVKRKRHTTNIDKIRQKIDPYSFPSGHISRLFASISPFYNLPYTFIISLILGIMASIARISKGYHYFSDCFVGMTAGIASSILAKITLNQLLLLIS